MSDTKKADPPPPVLVGNQAPAYLLVQDRMRRENEVLTALARLISTSGKPPSTGSEA